MGVLAQQIEIKKWSSYSDKEQTDVIQAGRSRMDGWQLKAFDKAYQQKVETRKKPYKRAETS